MNKAKKYYVLGPDSHNYEFTLCSIVQVPLTEEPEFIIRNSSRLVGAAEHLSSVLPIVVEWLLHCQQVDRME